MNYDDDDDDDEYGTEQTDTVTRLALEQIAVERKAERDRIGRIEFKSAGATRKKIKAA